MSTLLLVLLFVVIAVVFGYMAWKHHPTKNKTALTDTSKATAAAHAAAATRHAQAVAQMPADLTPAQQRKVAHLTEMCDRSFHDRGTCTVDPETYAVTMTCKDRHYGVNCSETCATSDSRPRTYTPGTSTSGATPATCECPPQYHFEDTDVTHGCTRTADSDAGCANNWYGPMCTKQGTYLDCGHGGTQAGASCVCPDGKTGQRCQWSTDMCTGSSSDTSRTYDANAVTQNPEGTGTQRCTCSPGYTGDHCDTCDRVGGYAETVDANQVKTCVQQPVCEVVIQSEGAGDVTITPTAEQLCTSAQTCPSIDLSGYGITNPKRIKMQRTSGTAACTAVVEANNGSDCTLSVTLPSTQTQLETTDLQSTVGHKWTQTRQMPGNGNDVTTGNASLQSALDSGTLTFTTQQLATTYNVTTPLSNGDYIRSASPGEYYVAQGHPITLQKLYVGSAQVISAKQQSGGGFQDGGQQLERCVSAFESPSENAQACANAFGNVCNWYW